jgi:dipeptidyl aminopeptidase/acylaminoacyl peptidase
MNSLLRPLAVLLLLAAVSFAKSTVMVNHWLVAGPFAASTPLFTDRDPKQAYDIDVLEPDFRAPPPQAGADLVWSPIDKAQWEVKNTDTLELNMGGTAGYVVFAASYITTTQRMDLEVTARAGHAIAAWFDGKPVGSEGEGEAKVYEFSGRVDAHAGTHLLVVKCTGEPTGMPAPWTIAVGLEVDDDARTAVTTSTMPRFGLENFADWGRFQELASPTVSADGKYIAVVRSARDASYKKDSWIEVYDWRIGKLIETIRPGSGLGWISFMPKSPALLYAVSGDSGTTLWSYDLVARSSEQIFRNFKDVDQIRCSPDEHFLYFVQDEEEPVTAKAYKLYDELEDRVFDYNRRRHIVEYSIQDHLARRLNELGTYAINDIALSIEGRKLAFTRYEPRAGRPFYNSELWVYDLQERTAGKVIDLALTETFGNLCWLPGGTRIAYGAGGYESAPTDTIFHNVNQKPLFIVDIKSKKITNLSANENWSIPDGGSRSQIVWSEKSGKLWFAAEDRGNMSLFCTPASSTPSFTRATLSRTYADAIAISGDGSVIAYNASSVSKPFALMAYDVATGKESVVVDPNADLINHAELAHVEDWSFTNSAGLTIDGWIYTPRTMDPAKQYPLVVYYYAGVSPIQRRFSYQHQSLAANGYVVYVLNPGGCIGYGQAFADIHCNDWGTRATPDIIEGTKKLLAAKPYLDAKHMAAFGMSYGGFTTLDLATKTDMFAALCDMYGISNIANYWGAGTWGYWYGDLALPGSFPWKNRDIFVDKSPIFSADKIKSPLLIFHGAADPNVPPTESDQMFTALKILGRDVTLVTFADETHNINVKFQNLITHRELMLEWFDKYLKDQPEGWRDRWRRAEPEKAKVKKAKTGEKQEEEEEEDD